MCLRLAVAEGADAQKDLFAEGRRDALHGVIEQRLQLSDGLFDGDTGFQTAVCPHDAAGVGVALLGGVECLGQEQVGLLHARHFKVLREDSNDLDGMIVDLDDFAGDGRVALVARLPEPIGDESDLRAVGAIFLHGEVAAQDGRDAERGQGNFARRWHRRAVRVWLRSGRSRLRRSLR